MWKLLPGLLFGFLARVVRGFKRNRGLLLSGAVAYYTLLSTVPMSILILIGLSHFISEERLFHTLSTYVEMVIPGYAAALTQQIQVFLVHRQAVGVIGFLVMLFFSSMAFTVLEDAMSVIFFHRAQTQRRHFLISAVIPYVYMLAIGLGIVLVSSVTGALEILEKRQLMILGWTLSFKTTSRVIVYTVGVMSEVFLLASIYLVMPTARIRFRDALAGGAAATLLWEMTRRVLVWYYSNLSMVNLIYGSFATAVVALLTTEAVAVILLLGAQVIAELEPRTEEPTGKGCSFFK
ncbi:MAG: YihY/virulence factor BrkB family protein [Syntrophorhabdales bacterium]|jgi:YihY family inner membrane protein